jgi:hypothetical protein
MHEPPTSDANHTPSTDRELRERIARSRELSKPSPGLDLDKLVADGLDAYWTRRETEQAFGDDTQRIFKKGLQEISPPTGPWLGFLGTLTPVALAIVLVGIPASRGFAPPLWVLLLASSVALVVAIGLLAKPSPQLGATTGAVAASALLAVGIGAFGYFQVRTSLERTMASVERGLNELAFSQLSAQEPRIISSGWSQTEALSRLLLGEDADEYIEVRANAEEAEIEVAWLHADKRLDLEMEGETARILHLDAEGSLKSVSSRFLQARVASYSNNRVTLSFSQDTARTLALAAGPFELEPAAQLALPPIGCVAARIDGTQAVVQDLRPIPCSNELMAQAQLEALDSNKVDG